MLPKLRGTYLPNGTGDNKLDLVFRDGHSFFVPAATESKINGVRKWEQAFRVYAAIYSKANPGRAAEIWQYVHIINVAASAYTWDNVANYDYTFRQLMAANPSRSWAKIYNQMWNIAMRSPIPYTNQGNNGGHGQYNGGAKGHNHNNNNKGDKAQGKGRKPKYCWAYNRSGSCKDGANCKYVNRCSYCDNIGHGKNTCTKKDNN